MLNRSKAKTDPAAAARRAKALELRVKGHSLREIAKDLGVSVGTVHAVIANALKGESAKDLKALMRLRNLELERLDNLWRSVWEKALKGNLAAVDTALKISAARCKILGLEAPAKIDILLHQELDAVLLTLQASLEPQVFAAVLRAISLPSSEMPKLN